MSFHVATCLWIIWIQSASQMQWTFSGRSQIAISCDFGLIHHSQRCQISECTLRLLTYATPFYWETLLPVHVVQQTADLGFIANSEFKSSRAAVSKARWMLEMVCRTISKMFRNVLLLSNPTVDRSQLAFFVQTWSPHLLGDVQNSERFSRKCN